MSWPMSQDYNEAVQSPTSSFSDAELRQTEAKCNAIGLPMPRSGNFADVYEMIGPGGKNWAVKCFTRQVAGLRERYAAISAYLKQANLPFMVDFVYLEQGIQVKGQWYPVLKMDWVTGFTLNEFIGQNADNPSLLEATAQLWLKLARRLREAKLAHCDLQHGNVLLVPGKRDGALSVRLIDYDGMFVPALAGKRSGEVGHPAFQHPQRLRDGTYNGEVDRFPHLVIYTALRALMVGSRYLWNKYDNGDNLLFKQAELETPSRSPLFLELLKLNDPEVRKLTEALIRAAKQPLEQTPLLDELVGTSQIAAAPPHTPPMKRRPAIRSRKRSLKVPMLLGAVLLALGGGWFAWNSGRHQDAPPPDEEAATAREPASLALLPVADVTVKPGHSTVLDIQVQRNEYHGPIILSVEGLPANVVALQAIIDVNENSGRIKLEAAGTAAATATRVRIVARGGELSAQSDIRLTVARGRALVLLPLANVTLKPGESTILEIKVQRQEWEGPIQVTVGGLPAVVKAEPAMIGANENAAQVRLTAAAEAEATQQRFHVVVKAGDLNARGEARLNVTSPDTPSLLPIPDVTLKPGESKDLKIEVQRNGFRGPIRVTLAGLPDKVTAAPATIGAEESAVQVKLTAAADAGVAEKPFQVLAAAGQRIARSEVKLTVPALSLALLPLADVTLMAGKDTVLEIKVERKNCKGPIRVTLDGLPDKVTAAPATIRENESAVKVKLSSAAAAAAVQRKPIRVVATADQLKAESEVRITIQKSAVVAASKVTVDLGGGVKLVLARIPAGTFWMGGGGGKPGERQEKIGHDFYLGVYAVTQEQWQAVMGSNPSHFSRTGGGKKAVRGISDADLKQFPVERVSWEDAQQFIQKLNAREKSSKWVYRLPTEAEWEYACRGGATSREECSFDYYFDLPTNDLSSSQANFNGNNHRTTMVGSYRPNRLGLYDMHGNVSQMCEDADEASRRVNRGGNYGADADGCRAGHRGGTGLPPSARGHISGFGLRLARVPSGQESK